MATNRGAYDPRQFLHYPDKDPFSDESQKRLDDLIQDFLRTGIAFANGASVQELTVEEQRERVEQTHQHLNGLTELEEELSPEAFEHDDTVEGESDGRGSESRRVDKGKGRDEREGPGLQGLWARTTVFASSTSPLQGVNADDAISLSSGSDSGRVALEEVDPEDEEGSYEVEPHEDGALEGVFYPYEQDGYQEEGSEGGTELEPTNSRAQSSEQEIIYVGDSDEDQPNSRALSDVEAEGDFESHSGSVHAESVPGYQLENVSGSQLDETEEQGAHQSTWHANHELDEDDGEEHEWQHHSKGKESEDEGHSLADAEQEDEEEELPWMREADTYSAARHFFTPAPLIDPWASSSGKDALISPSLSPAVWGGQPPRRTEPENESKEDKEDANGEDIDDAFQSSSALAHELHSDLQTNAEPVGLGRSQEQDLVEDTYSSHPPPAMPVTSIVDTSLQLLVSDSVLVKPMLAPEVMDSFQDAEFRREVMRVSDGGEANTLASTTLPREDTISHTSGFAVVGTTSIFSTTNGVTGLSSPITNPTSQIPPADPSEILDFFDMVPPMEPPNTGIPESYDAGDIQESVHETDDSSSRTNGAGITLGKPDEELLVDSSTASSGPPNEPILRDATFSLVSDELQRQFDQFDSSPAARAEVVQVDSVHIQRSPLSTASTEIAKASPNISQEVQSAHGDHKSVSRDPGEETSPLAEEEVLDKDVHQFNSTTLHPAIFTDHDSHTADVELPGPFCTAKAGNSSPGLECHSVSSTDLHHDEVEHGPYSVIEVRPENDENVGGEELGVEEVSSRNPSAAGSVSPDYAVSEEIPQGGQNVATSSEGDAGAIDLDQKEHPERFAPPFPVPTISAGSSTPPLSPTATVTNCSSAQDASIATSDLPTVNPTTVSVVASTSSPPPIHVSPPSPIPVDVRQPPGSRVGFVSDEDEDDTVLPDPRLPPEPTHLRIPVGIVSQGLTDDKEERAESVKVEPPTPHVRSDSEDGSVTDIGEIQREKRSLLGVESTVTPEKRESSEALKEHEEPVGPRDVATNSTNHMANGDEAHTNQAEAEREAILPELTYPDSDSDYLSKGRGGSIALTDQPLSPSEGRKLSFSPHPTHEDPRPSSSPVSDYIPSTVPPDGGRPSRPAVDGSSVLNTGTQAVDANGHTGPCDDGDAIKDTLSDSPRDSPQLTPRDVAPATPIVTENGSPNKVKYSPRSSTKGKAKGKDRATASVDSRTESPPPRSTIRVQGRGSATSRKRSRASDTTFEPSKQRRLTRSSAAKNMSTLSTGSVTSASAVSDDRSDVSSIASSSSLVSHILRPTSSKPSSFATIPSRSPSIVSQSSPTSMMAPPIRPYVPHNHSYHTSVPPMSTASPRRRPTPVPRRSLSASPSPSPSALPQHTSTHQTRASCTDHKISIPGPDGLLYFLIPRCSLLEPEVEKDDSIVDCGVATEEEVKRAVGDLEAVGIDSNTLGVVRQLAGVQLMREGQVGYLPKPGERVRRGGKQRRSHIPPPPLAQDVAPQVDPIGLSGSPHSALLDHDSPLSPVSSSESSLSDASIAGAGGFRKRRSKALNTDHERNEPSPEHEEEEDGSEPDGGTTVSHPLLSSPKLAPLPKSTKSRRRGLRRDDAAYKPENDGAVSSSDVESSGAKKKGRGSLKRRRSEASTQGENGVVEPGRTPTKKRKRRDVETPADHDEPKGASESRKKPRRKANSHKPDSANSLV